MMVSNKFIVLSVEVVEVLNFFENSIKVRDLQRVNNYSDYAQDTS